MTGSTSNPTTRTWPCLFATVSGAHLYGFPSPDSDWDLRGCHLLPAREFPLGDEAVTAEMLAADLNTIPYEILTLPGPTWTWVPAGDA